jgi:curved DNA-binding protein
MVDYYEFLQISPNADLDTIHRVFRFLAARFHPDNPRSGNPEQFRLLKTAYDVLSDRQRRSEYDAARRQDSPQPFSSSIDFMDSREGELNRRLAVLAVLYHKRRSNPTFPEVSLADMEERMGFPRDYMDFTLWYLQKKGYVTKADNAQYALTAEGVDFVESQRIDFPNLNKMLTSGSDATVEDMAPMNGRPAPPEAPARPERRQHAPAPPSSPIILPASMEEEYNRRVGPRDRRVGAPDLRAFRKERRTGIRDRRLGLRDRRNRPNGRPPEN